MKKPEDDFEFKYITTLPQAKMAAEVLRREDVILVDTETTGLQPHTSNVHLVQIGNPNFMFVVNAFDKANVAVFKDVLESKSKLKVLQNAVFDYKMLKYHFDIELNNMYDTMLAELLLTSGFYGSDEARKHASLAALTKKYLNIELEKTIRMDFTKIPHGFDFSTRPDLLKYSALDVYYPAYIYKMQRSYIIEKGLADAARFEFDLIPVCGGMELAGVAIDVDLWRKFIQDVEVKYYKVQNKINRIFNRHTAQKVLWADAEIVNISSPKQVLNVLNRMGIPVTDTDHYTFLEYQDVEIIKLLLEYKRYDKLINAYGETILNKIDPKTNRLHVSFNQLGASATSRMSSNNCNLQQVPTAPINLEDGRSVSLRDCFVPKAGYKFVAGDFSQQEVRIAGHFYDEALLWAAYKEEKDVYRMLASIVFNRPYEDIDKKSFERTLCKTIVLASNYGGGPGVLQRNLLETGIKITEKDAKKYLDKYNDAFPDLNENMSKWIKKCMTKGYVEYNRGRKRFIGHMIHTLNSLRDKPDEYNELRGKIYRRIKNTPIQGNGADMTKSAMLRIWKALKENCIDGNLCLAAHDELVLEVREDQTELAAKLLKQSMEDAFQEVCPGFPNTTSTTVMDKWEKD